MPSRPSDIAPATAPARISAWCSCHTSSMSTSAGEITVVRVFGDVDRSTEHVVAATLAEARERRPSHLVVDVAGMGFCSVRGLALLAAMAQLRERHHRVPPTPHRRRPADRPRATRTYYSALRMLGSHEYPEDVAADIAARLAAALAAFEAADPP